MAVNQQVNPVTMVLAAQVAAMRTRAETGPMADIARDLHAIRKLAQANGYAPVLPVIHALDHVLSKQARQAPIQGWIDLLEQAVGCGNDDPKAEAAFAAYCSTRLGC